MGAIRKRACHAYIKIVAVCMQVYICKIYKFMHVYGIYLGIHLPCPLQFSLLHWHIEVRKLTAIGPAFFSKYYIEVKMHKLMQRSIRYSKYSARS